MGEIGEIWILNNVESKPWRPVCLLYLCGFSTVMIQFYKKDETVNARILRPEKSFVMLLLLEY